MAILIFSNIQKNPDVKKFIGIFFIEFFSLYLPIILNQIDMTTFLISFLFGLLVGGYFGYEIAKSEEKNKKE
jgi:hypothetical protein